MTPSIINSSLWDWKVTGQNNGLSSFYRDSIWSDGETFGELWESVNILRRTLGHSTRNRSSSERGEGDLEHPRKLERH